MLKVLIVEDNLMLADLLEDALVEGGYQVCGTAYTVDEAIALAHTHKPDLAVMDYRLGNGCYGADIRPHLEGNDCLSRRIIWATC